ncbi:BTAD domain-containing putative transcriptional regulator [Umezawaea sp. Da 62-37]|uniref:AfsR/SARP family transcriptional regulator n=1 Tax=Umezawaea sp. Da 62-37 TaxID=3075927 RepID=UPI0028F71773|nr:BTAD domain-containing putative transcriptional regulator [Umezawaea sp. Da 62-37]WNV91812.1 BTAD domain-containing putative transcriptional regulator [Umezawaea sp. Da 62-37]
MDIDFAILGRTSLRIDGRLDAGWGPPKLRALLTALLIRPGVAVSSTELADWIWSPDDLPNNPEQVLYLYSSRIRGILRRLSNDTDIVVDNRNFRLDVDSRKIDYFHFQDRVRHARAHARRGDHQRALDTIREGFDLWGHRPLADGDGEAADAWRRRMRENVQIPAYDTLFAQQLALGEADAVLAKLDELDIDHRMNLALFKRRLEALHAMSRADEATKQFLTVHKALRADFDDIGARDLREFHDRLKANGAAPPVVPAFGTTQTPNQLPPDVRKFFGHEQLLVKVDAVTTRPGLLVVHGVGGVGKTAFVVHWAHTAAKRFPDGLLHIDLHGYSNGPVVEPAIAVDRFLQAFGITTDRIPEPEHRATKLQSLLAGKQVLVLLDNARDTEHVSPLLPLLTSCVVVVVSRSHLSGLATRQTLYRFPLTPLDPERSSHLLAAHIDDRAETDPEALVRLARLCGGLPIALKTLAQYIATRPSVPLHVFVPHLTHHLRLLDIGSVGDGANHGPRAVFAQSVRALTPDAQRLFRLLGIHPGPDFGVGVAAALGGAGERRTELVLDAMVEANLLEVSGTLGRFKFHDLVREFAADLIESPDERRAAESRVLDFYMNTAENVDKAVFPTQARVRTNSTGDESLGVRFQDEQSARMWCVVERHNLTFALNRAVAVGHLQAAQLPQLIGQTLLRHGYFEESLKILHVGLSAAQSRSDVEEEANALHNIALTNLLRQRFREAEHHVHRAHIKYNEIGDEVGIAACLHTGARIMVETGNVIMGIDSHERALRMFRRISETGLELISLYRTGEAYQRASEYVKAASYYREALSLARDQEDIVAQGRTLVLMGSLGFARKQVAEARDHLLAGLSLAAEVHDIGTAGTACGLLAEVELKCGRMFEATQYGRQSIRLCGRAFDSRGEVAALETLAAIFTTTSRYEAAVEAREHAKAILDDLDPGRDTLAG